jgi:hypothetical protein
MSLYSNRGVYTAAANKAAYNQSNGRMLYADAGLVYASACAYFYGYYGGDYNLDPLTEAKWQNTQNQALVSLKAQTSLQSNGIYAQAFAWTIRQKANKRFLGYHAASWYPFSIPTGLRGDINKFSIRANIGAGEFWDATGRDGYSFNYAAYNDFGCVLKIFFSQSSTEYADGDDLYSGTADVEITLADINAAHVERGNAIAVGGSAVGRYTSFSKIVISCDAAIAKINAFTSNNIYVWVVITRPNYFTYLFDDDHGYDVTEEFDGMAMFNNPAILVTKNA